MKPFREVIDGIHKAVMAACDRLEALWGITEGGAEV
jgi:hypothetical protein|nr:MAG TPA_asm: hypothetical protein [Caudoviricetes sp.]